MEGVTAGLIEEQRGDARSWRFAASRTRPARLAAVAVSAGAVGLVGLGFLLAAVVAEGWPHYAIQWAGALACVGPLTAVAVGLLRWSLPFGWGRTTVTIQAGWLQTEERLGPLVWRERLRLDGIERIERAARTLRLRGVPYELARLEIRGRGGVELRVGAGYPAGDVAELERRLRQALRERGDGSRAGAGEAHGADARAPGVWAALEPADGSFAVHDEGTHLVIETARRRFGLVTFLLTGGAAAVLGAVFTWVGASVVGAVLEGQGHAQAAPLAVKGIRGAALIGAAAWAFGKFRPRRARIVCDALGVRVEEPGLWRSRRHRLNWTEAARFAVAPPVSNRAELRPAGLWIEAATGHRRRFDLHGLLGRRSLAALVRVLEKARERYAEDPTPSR